MNKQFWLIILLLFLCPFNSSGEEPQKRPDFSQWEKMPILVWAEYVEELPYYYLSQEREIKLNDDWSVDESVHYRIKVQKETAKSLGEQEIYYNKTREEIVSVEAFVETEDGQKYPSVQVQDLDVLQETPMYSDLKVKVLTLPQVNIGSIIDVKIKWRILRGVIPNQFERSELYPFIPHLKYKVVYRFPQDKKIFYKEHHPAVKPVLQNIDDEVIYTYEYKRTYPFSDTESYLPPFQEIVGQTAFSSMDDWGTVTRWYGELAQKNIVEDERIRATTENLIKDKKTQKQKANAILEFLQDNLRYVSLSFGDHAVEPHPTNEVFLNRYGDCKDWALLAKQMLGIAGIKAHLCLFNDEYAGDPRWGLPAVSVFDHVILEIECDGKRYLADPQLKGYDLGQFPQDYNNAYLFIMEGEQYRFEQIESSPVQLVRNFFKIYAQLDAVGGAHYDVKAQLGLDPSGGIRYFWNNSSKDQRKQFWENIERTYGRGGRLSKEPQLDGVDKRYGSILMTFQLHSPNAYQKTNNMIILLEPFERYFPNPFMERERYYPLFFQTASLYDILAVYTIPETFVVDFVPEDFSLKNDLLELSRKITKEGSQISVFYRFYLRRGRWPNQKYEELIRLWEEYERKIREAIVLKKGK